MAETLQCTMDVNDMRNMLLWYWETIKDRLHAGMDSNSEEQLAPDEMYLMLQADMISIKKQEQALQSEIEEIAAKFKSLLESCGLEAEFPVPMVPPSTPSFTQNSLTYVTACTTTPSFMNISPEHMNISPEHMNILSSSTSEESLFPTNPMYSLAESEDANIMGLVLEESKSKTLILDNNSNYMNSSHSDTEANMDHTSTIEMPPSMEFTDNSNSSTTSSASNQSSEQDGTSDGYPKSDDSSDNQVVPECYDLDKEFMSRLQYYSDFTIDRQRKINSMVCQLSKLNNDSQSSAFAEELFTRHVEGAESSHSPVRAPLKTYSSSSGGSSDNFSTPRSRRGKKSMRDRTTSSRSSRKSTSIPIASSTMLNDSFMSGSSGRSSQRSSSSSHPIASSTLLDETIFFSSGSKTKSSMVPPRASSTMIEETILSQATSRPRSNNIVHSTLISELPSEMPSRIGPNNEGSVHSQEDNEDLESIYTWSIHDDVESDNVNLEESYMRNVMRKSTATAGKPPLPPPRHRVYSNGNAGYRESYKDGKCKDHKLHKILGESCSRHDLEAISAIEADSNVREGNLFVESLYEDEEHFPCKPNIIPRSSTQIRLQDKSSGSSSMEAKRASIPDLYSVSTPNNEYHSTVQTSNSNSTDSSPLQERLELVGKSSSSNEKDNSSNVPPPPNVTIRSPTTESQKDALVDSILTDSPNSVSSSGIFAPCNSPARNCSSSSKVSGSTTSGKNSADSNNGSKAIATTLVTRPQPQPTMPTTSEQSQRNEDTVENVNSVFKVPKQSMPLKHLFKFRRHKCKTPDNLQSEPHIVAPSVQSDPLSRRDRFPSSPSVRHEPRIVDKKAVIRKFKRFSETFYKKDKSGRVKIQTLANL